MNEVLPGVTVDDPYSQVIRPFRHKCDRSRSFFFDAPRVTGKKFTIRSIQSILRVRGQKVFVVATSAVATSLFENGRTAHSTFKIPIPCSSESVRNISMDSKLASTIRQANLNICDEVVMCVRCCVEAVDCTLRAITKSPCVPFCRKCILFSGDFRKIVPVVPRGSRRMIVFMSLKSSTLFSHLKLLELKRNLRLKAMEDDPCADTQALRYPNYLLQVGEGQISGKDESEILSPPSVTVVQNTTQLVESAFKNLEKNMLMLNGLHHVPFCVLPIFNWLLWMKKLQNIFLENSRAT